MAPVQPLAACGVWGVMVAKLLKLCTLPAIGSQNLALVLGVVLALFASRSPAVAGGVHRIPDPYGQ
jgi:hypothetical protein